MIWKVVTILEVLKEFMLEYNPETNDKDLWVDLVDQDGEPLVDEDGDIIDDPDCYFSDY